MAISESQLIDRSQKGDRRAFEELVRLYQKKVFGIAYGIVRNKDDALDISQEAFYRAYKNIGNFKRESKFYTWIYRITVNLCLDFVQKRSRTATYEHDDSRQVMDSHDLEWRSVQSGNRNPVRSLETKELGEVVLKCMNRLTENHRAVLSLREIEGLSYEEIAKVMECSIGTVMSRLFHARQNIKKLMQGYLNGED